jgi:hypothetical protein
MRDLRDFIERALVFVILLMALSGIAVGVANVSAAGLS